MSREINRQKSDSLKYISNLGTTTVEKMKNFRAKCVDLARDLEDMGASRETGAAFTALEHCQMLGIKHLCMVDPDGVMQECEPANGCCGTVASDMSDPAAA